MAHQQKIAIADDGGEDVVEIVRHASRQHAHRLHLLHLGELALEHFLARGIDHIENGARLAVGRSGERACEQMRGAVGRGAGADLDGLGAVRAARRARDRGERGVAFAGAQQIAELGLGAHEEIGEGAVRLDDGAVGGDDGDTHGRIAEEIGKADQRRRRLGLGERRFGRRRLGQTRHEPPCRLAALQGPHRSRHALAGFGVEVFLACAAFDGGPLQPVESGRRFDADEGKLGRGRRFALARAGKKAVRHVAIEHRTVARGDRPGDVGGGGGIGGAARLDRAFRAPRPDRRQRERRHHAHGQHQNQSRPARHAGHGDRDRGARHRDAEQDGSEDAQPAAGIGGRQRAAQHERHGGHFLPRLRGECPRSGRGGEPTLRHRLPPPALQATSPVNGGGNAKHQFQNFFFSASLRT